MPRATVLTNTVRHELKTPSGDPNDPFYVVLKPMPYGVKLRRMQDAMQMTMKGQQNRKRGQQVSADTEVKILQAASTLIDFRTCIASHNLEDEHGRTLDFNNEADFASLDSRVGEEISTLIDEMNNFEAPSDEDPEGEEGNSEVR